ncbi:MAG: hypothetical protein JSV12_00375 [Candidatus Bathyarchaeota archaeon]|nr:MAG: hypothetical protein JSV12_00375 [Candidatus Bathyarchaeota archaeon]
MSNEPGIIVCPNPRCHRKIEEPILLKSLSRTPVEQYHACPHCLIKLDVNVENVQILKEREKEKEKEKPMVKPLVKEGKSPSGCLHHLGYLANRAKNAPIPQECLICPKTVECMLKLYQEEEHCASK